jgi:hypothetical protein
MTLELWQLKKLFKAGYPMTHTYTCSPWLISQGEQVYFKALRNPDSLADLDATQEDIDFEPLLYVADEAFAIATGKEEDESFPRNIAYEQGLDYDGPTETKGEDWTEEQLPTLLPKLWAKHN